MAVIYSSLYFFTSRSLAADFRKTTFRLVVSILLLFSLLPTSAQTYVFARLDGAPMNTTGWTMNGEAAVANIIYNNNSELMLASARTFTSGGIFFNQPINLSMCSKWRAEFDFRIFGGTGADGLAFSFLSAPPSGFVNGEGLGLPSGIDGLKVCFDTYNNCNSNTTFRMPKVEIRWGIGYSECWSQPTKDNRSGDISFIRSDPYKRAVISYDNGNITVTVNGTLMLTTFQQFNFTGYLGFTASTGSKTDNHSIRNAIIYTEMPPSEAGNALNSTCNILSGQLGTGSTAGYTYTWSPSTGLSNPSVSNPTLQLTNNGTSVLQQKYYVRTAFTANPGCSSIDSVVVQVNPLPTVGLSLPFTAVCSNIAPLTLTGGTPSGGTYSGPGVSAGIFSPAVAGSGNHTITYTFTNASGCANSVTQSITVHSAQQVVATADLITCLGNSVSLTAANALSYNWSPNSNLSATTGSAVLANPITTTTYTVTGTDANSCVSSDQVVVSVVPKPTASITYNGNPFCGNQSIPVSRTGQPGGTYSAPVGLSLDPGTGTIQLAGSTPGTYTVTYTFGNTTCTEFTQTTVTILPPPFVSFSPAIPTSCLEGVPMTVTGGFPAGGTYSGAGIIGATFYPAIAGRGTHVITYTYTNMGGCSNSATNVAIVYPLTSVTAAPDRAICAGAVVPITATGADTYTWAPNYQLSSTSGDMVMASPLTTTTYTVTGMDIASGCTSQASVTVSVLSAPTATLGYAGSPFCRQGNALVSLSGQTGGMFSSDAGLSIDPSSGTIDLANSTPGNYTITYTFTNGGCSGITSTSITILPPPSVSLMPLGTVCFTSLPFSLTGGMPLGGQYAGAGISGGIFDPAVAGKGIHTITYTVIDGGGCMATASQTILVSPLTPVSAIADLSTCIGSMVTLTATAAVSYQWIPGSLSGSVVTIVPVTTTTYTVTGIHADGCSSQDQVTVLVRPLPHAAIEYPGTPFCNMGIATVSRTGQAGGTYSSTAGLILDAATGAIDLAASTPGIYTVTYTFSDGTCTGVTTTSIEISTPPVVTLHLTSATVCINAVAFTLTGGMPVGGIYSGTSVAGNQFDPTTAGRGQHLITYTYTTAAGCSSSATEILTVHPLIDVNAGSDISVCVGNTVILSASNAVSYAWTPNSSLSAATGQEVVASPLTTTLYRVTGTDVQGCTSHDDVWVFVQPLPTASIQYPSNVYCNTGQASVIRTGVAGGSYSADVGLIINATTGEIDLSASTPGSYTVTYSFSNGSCSNEATTEVTIVPPPSVSLNLPISSSCVNGTAVTLSGGSPVGGTYSGAGISAGVFTPAVAGNGVHVITYVYMDAGGCTASATASFTVNPLVNVQAGADQTICMGATATLTAIHALSYSWSPSQTLSSSTGSSVVASPLTTTSYTVTGMDANGCSSSDVITVQVLPLPTASISYAGNPFCNSGTAAVTRMGQAGGSYTSSAGLSINATSGEINLSSSTPGSYTVTYNFSNGSCSNEATTMVTIVPPPAVSLNLPISSSCVNGTAVTLSGGSPVGGTYSGAGISAGVFTPAVAGNGVHVITYVYMDAGGCTASATANFTVNPLVNVQAGADQTICMGATATLTAIHAVSYSWSPSQTLSSSTGSSVVASPLTTTSYTVTGMDANGCSSSDVITVQVLPLPTASISYVGNPFCQSGTAPVSRVGQVGGSYTSSAGLSIDAASGEINLSSSTPGSYTVTYSFSSGSCSSKVSTEVTIFSLPNVSYLPSVNAVCIQANPFSLTGGSPTGGVYRGPGVLGDLFDPRTAGTGIHTIEYTYTNTKGCAMSATATIAVSAVSQGITPMLFPEVCVNATSFTLSVTSGIPPGGQFLGNGVMNNQFNPASAGIGIHIIRYLTPGVSGCTVLYTGTIQVNPKPALQVTAPQQVCEGTQVQINAQSAGDLFWSDSTSAALQIFNGVLTLRAIRTSTFLITCRDGKGCSNVQPVTIQVAVPPDARFQYDRNQYCNDGTVGVQLAGLSGGIFSSIPGIALNQTTGQINLSASQPGMYTIKYAVSNTAGCQSQFSSSIEIREKPVLAIVDLVLCQGNLQAITTTAALGGSSRWESNRNDIVEVDTQGVVRGLKAGQAQVKFTSPSGCSTSLSVTVKALPVLRGRNIVCKNDSIQLLVGTAAGLASQFTSLFPGIAGITSNGWIMGLKEGNALIRYQDADGCMATHPIQVDVVPERVTGPAVACEPATVRLDKPMQAVYGSSGYTFIYWKDPGQTVLLNNPMRIAESGKYYVQVRNGNGCKADKPVEVQVFIAKSLQPRRLDTVKTQNNTPIQLRGRPNGVAYLWSPAAGLNAATIQNPWFNYLKNMEYQVAVQTDSGCVVTDTVFVKAVDANVFVPTAFTPNRDGLNDKLTPICYSIQRISYFSVFNRWGELVFTTNSIGKGWDGTNKGSPAEPGTYVWMLEAVGLDGQLFRQKGTVVLIR